MAKTKTSISIKIRLTTQSRLDRHMTYADSIDSTINRALDALEKLEKLDKAVPAPRGVVDNEAREIRHRNIPDLTHTRILYARVDDETISKPDWNPLLGRMVSLAISRGMDPDDIGARHRVRLVPGRTDDKGYAFVPDAGVSVRYVNTNTACRSIIGIAKELDATLEIHFGWHRKERAARPGKSAKLLVPESASADMRLGR